MQYRLKSNVKINLHLDVLYKYCEIKNNKISYFHKIQSIFFPITCSDVIYINKKNGIAKKIDQITIRTINSIPLDNRNLFEEVSERGCLKNNLVYKLLEEVLKNIDLPQLEILIIKRIPPGSGVGGGSSNAGTILRFLIEQNFISFDDANSIANDLGSDILFFLYNKPSIVLGRGEIIHTINKEDLEIFKNIYGIINFNNKGISTKIAYESLKKPLQEDYIKIYDTHKETGKQFFHKFFPANDIKSFLEKCKNDFEIYAFGFKELLEIKKLLEITNPLKVMLTGSGSGIYSLYENKKKMLEALSYLKKFENSQRVFRPFKFII
ncbi:MAG: 4-diphosphocytidyl-2-C-methyl-D-erythritol kinase [Leptospiraceae bacterium]|nr:MAG: 4-diphosphocytidyl-2-C-methyl-D-erythritol kinase [Leptospiraceae bacterium]